MQYSSSFLHTVLFHLWPDLVRERHVNTNFIYKSACWGPGWEKAVIQSCRLSESRMGTSARPIPGPGEGITERVLTFVLEQREKYPFGPKSLLNFMRFVDGGLYPKYRRRRKVRSLRVTLHERMRVGVRESTHGIGITLSTFPPLLCAFPKLPSSNFGRRQKAGWRGEEDEVG